MSKKQCEEIIHRNIERMVLELSVVGMNKETLAFYLNGKDFLDCIYCKTPNQSKIGNVDNGGEMYHCTKCNKTYFKLNE